MKTEKRKPLYEVVFMLTLCLVAAEWVVYPQYDANQIYFALALCVTGIAVSYFISMPEFFSYFIIAAIINPFVPLVWVLINGGWDKLLETIKLRALPFVEFPVSSYLVAGIFIYFVVYASKRVPALIKKA